MKKKYLWGLLCCFLCVKAEAQFPITFTSDEGLSNTCIRLFLQDSYQNVWICTQNGLNRYDGAKMNVYHHKNGVEGTLNHDNVTSVLELRPGTVLVGTELGVQAYDYATDRFSDLPLIDQDGDTVMAHVISMTFLPDSMVYVTTAGYGLYRLTEGQGRGAALNQVDDFPVDEWPMRMMGDTRGRTWMTTGQGDIFLIDRGKVRKVGRYPGVVKFCENVSGVIYAAAGTNGLYRYSEDRREFRKVEASRNFMNKIWNASRFVLMNAEGADIPDISQVKLSPADKWIISRLESCIKEVTLNMGKFELGIAAGALYDFMWSDFCDWYIELCKSSLYSDDAQKKGATLSVLCFVLENALKLLHPFIPFITEEIYQNIPGTKGSIMVSEFPRYNSKMAYKKEAKAFETVMDVIKAVRNIKTSVNCPPAKKVKLFLAAQNNKRILSVNAAAIAKLAGASEIEFVENGAQAGEKTMSQVIDGCTVIVPLGELVDIEKEKERLSKELERIIGEISRADGKLHNRGFMEKAPKALVEGERAKLEKFIEMKEKVEKQLKDLG